MEPEVGAAVGARLAEIEAAEGVRVLYAAESGSRAWGFASPDSDYDVRFIYRHPADWYLSLAEARDVIERPIGADRLDVSGWDLRKALRLFLRSNPPLYEWLVSPIVYLDRDGFAAELRRLAEATYSRHAMARHYLSMAESNRKTYFSRPGPVRLKKYFYSIRPLLALDWLLDRASLPPMDLAQLCSGAALAGEVRDAVAGLLARKRAGAEAAVGPRIEALERWIDTAIEAAEPAVAALARAPAAEDAVNSLYRRLVRRDLAAG